MRLTRTVFGHRVRLVAAAGTVLALALALFLHATTGPGVAESGGEPISAGGPTPKLQHRDATGRPPAATFVRTTEPQEPSGSTAGGDRLRLRCTTRTGAPVPAAVWAARSHRPADVPLGVCGADGVLDIARARVADKEALVITAEGYVPRRVERDAFVRASRLHVELDRACTIRGSCTSLDGKPVAGVRLAARGALKAGGRWYGRTTTLDDGRFTLDPVAPGKVALQSLSPDWRLRGGLVLVRAPADGLRLVVERRDGISGRVVDTDGMPLGGVWVCCGPGAGDAGWSASMLTDDDGLFFVRRNERTPDGPIRLGIENPFALLRRQVWLRDARWGEKNVLLLHPAYGRLRVRLVASNGRIPTRVSYRLHERPGPAAGRRFPRSVPGPDGHFEIWPILPGRYWLQLIPEGDDALAPSRWHRVTIGPQRTTEIEVHLRKLMTARVIVVRGANEPEAGAEVALLRAEEAPRGSSWAELDPQLRTDAEGLPCILAFGRTDAAGECTLRFPDDERALTLEVRSRTGEWVRRDASALRLPGHVELVTLAKPGKVIVRLSHAWPDAGERLSCALVHARVPGLALPRRWRAYGGVAIAADATVRFGEVAPGPWYALLLWKTPLARHAILARSSKVQVPAGGRREIAIDLQGAAPRRLSGWIEKPLGLNRMRWIKLWRVESSAFAGVDFAAAKVDARGHFRIDAIPAGRYVVVVNREAPFRRFFPDRILDLRYSDLVDCRIRVFPTQFHAVLVDRQGRPVQGARVEVTAYEGLWRKRATSDARGRLSFPEFPAVPVQATVRAKGLSLRLTLEPQIPGAEAKRLVLPLSR